MSNIAVIPARGGSKGLQNKNILILNKKPLIAWTIIAAKNVEAIEHVVVTTDDAAIKDIAYEYGADLVIDRPDDLSMDLTPTLPVIQHAIGHFELQCSQNIEYVITLQPTSPLRNSEHIKEALKKMVLFEGDSLVSCIEVPTIFQASYQLELVNENFLVVPPSSEHNVPRQLKKMYAARNGSAIYITKRKLLDQFLFGGRCVAYFMDMSHSIDINSIEDFKTAEKFFC